MDLKATAPNDHGLKSRKPSSVTIAVMEHHDQSKRALLLWQVCGMVLSVFGDPSGRETAWHQR